MIVEPQQRAAGRGRVHRPRPCTGRPTAGTRSPRSRPRVRVVLHGGELRPVPRFIAPFKADVHDIDHWVAAGEIWDNRPGWDTDCSGADVRLDGRCTTRQGRGRWLQPAAAVAVNGATTYAAWVGGGGNPGPAVRHAASTPTTAAPGTASARRTCRTASSPAFTVDPGNAGSRLRRLQRLLAPVDPRRRPGRGIRVARRRGDVAQHQRQPAGCAWRLVGFGQRKARRRHRHRGVCRRDVGAAAVVPGRQHPQRVGASRVRPLPYNNGAVVGTHGLGIWRVIFG